MKAPNTWCFGNPSLPSYVSLPLSPLLLLLILLLLLLLLLPLLYRHRISDPCATPSPSPASPSPGAFFDAASANSSSTTGHHSPALSACSCRVLSPPVYMMRCGAPHSSSSSSIWLCSTTALVRLLHC